MAQIDINPSDDSMVVSDVAGGNYGAHTTPYVRKKAGADDRIFIKFSLASIPAGASILSATIYLYVTAYADSPTDVKTLLCDADWAEGTITYTNQPGVVAGNIHTFDMSSTGWKNCSGDMKATVKGWHRGTIDNYGIRLYPDTATNNYSKINSKEHASNKPYLRVIYANPAFLLNMMK